MRIFLHNVLTVAKNTFTESVRDKILYGIFAFAFMFITFTIFLGSISLGEDLHVVRSLGLAGMYLFGILIAVFLGTSLVYKELERRTLYFILSKPITRMELVVGKSFGLFGSVALSLAGMALVYLAVVAYEGGGFDLLGLAAVAYELLELGLLIALSTFFSSYSRPFASTVYALLVVYIGHSTGMLLESSKKSGPVLQDIFKAAYYVFPNLEKFNIRDSVLYGVVPSAADVSLTILYAALYIVLLLYAASLLLQRREL